MQESQRKRLLAVTDLAAFIAIFSLEFLGERAEIRIVLFLGSGIPIPISFN